MSSSVKLHLPWENNEIYLRSWMYTLHNLMIFLTEKLFYDTLYLIYIFISVLRLFLLTIEMDLRRQI